MRRSLTENPTDIRTKGTSVCSLPESFLTSALEVRALPPHREVRFVRWLGGGLHVGLAPVPLPAVIAVLSVATVVSILAAGAAAEPGPRPPGAAVAVAVLPDLSLRQQACGLPPAGASLVLLVLAIELWIETGQQLVVNLSISTEEIQIIGKTQT